MELQKIKEKLKRVEEIYNSDYENGDSMANDLLDQAETIMALQNRVINLLEDKVKILRIEVEEHKKHNPVFADGGNLEECMVLRGRIEDLETLNRDLTELLRKVMQGVVKGEYEIDGDLVIKINRTLEGVEDSETGHN